MDPNCEKHVPESQQEGEENIMFILCISRYVETNCYTSLEKKEQ